jgi:mRNA interferase ChpB
MRGDHYCLVVSPKTFNKRFQLAMVCPISGGSSTVARDTGFLISLMGFGLKTDGNVHAHQLTTLDWTMHKAQRIEKAPDEIVQQILGCLIAVFEEN